MSVMGGLRVDASHANDDAKELRMPVAKFHVLEGRYDEAGLGKV